jgi:hypothetical protein
MSTTTKINTETENLMIAAAQVERSAYALAGHVNASKVAQLMLLAAELERSAANFSERPKLSLVQH